jgi:hypothetical protein
MAALPQTNPQDSLFSQVLTELQGVGYERQLIEKDYGFSDWFVSDVPRRTINAALFGRLPADYDTALIGVTLPNGVAGAALVNQYRALGAPIILEVDTEQVGIWTVSAAAAETTKTASLNANEFASWVKKNKDSLQPLKFLRTKSLHGRGPTCYQNGLFDGLIPELEERISKILDPRLTVAFKDGWNTYQRTTGTAPAEDLLFKVAFWVLAGKVFADRHHPNFTDLISETATADNVLARIGAHYKTPPGDLLNRETREAIFRHVWSNMDFRNLSVEALSQIWLKTLVTSETRKRLGIHRTRRSIVRFIIDRMPFDGVPPNERHVLEPCSGSATFLICAMERMREVLPPEINSVIKQHAYFRKLLKGFEKDPFGVEISQLCLSLADYPNANGWHIEPKDVFVSRAFVSALRTARFVLCNPPFERFDPTEEERLGTQSKHLPAELLNRVLDNLHPDGVLGFVLPRIFLDHSAYRSIRKRLGERYAKLEIVSHPDKGWETAAPDTVILIATDPVPHLRTVVHCGIVRRSEWQAFDRRGEVPTWRRLTVAPSGIEDRIPVPELPSVWDFLDSYPKLQSVTRIVHKGVEWNIDLENNWSLLVRPEPFPDSHISVRPRRKTRSRSERYWQFQMPAVAYLNFATQYQRRPDSFKQPWGEPKVIFAKGRASRGPWRGVAFADLKGIACSETFVGIWPTDNRLIVPLAAVLNGPIANAFIYSHGDKPHTALATIRAVPVPHFSERQVQDLEQLVHEYVVAASAHSDPNQPNRTLESLTLEIDAMVLDAYGLPPPLEREMLNFFRGHTRPLPYRLDDYVGQLIRKRLTQQLSALDEDAEEQQRTWIDLKRTLDENRLSYRKLFS